jgi:hypothetical protein
MTISATGSMRFSKRHKFGAIYADPPWSFRNWSAKGTGRNAVSHYDCLDLSKLAALPVADLAADDCALFLWATDPLLDRAFELIEAWGFDDKTVAFYWVKLNTRASTTPISSRPGAAGPTPSSVYWQRAVSPHAGQKTYDDLWSKNDVSTAVSRIAWARGSNGLSADLISNCSLAKRNRAGIAGAIKQDCSIRERSQHDGNHRAY